VLKYRPFRSALILVGVFSVVGSGLALLASRGSLPSPSVDAQDIPDPQQGAAPDEIRVSSRAYVAPSLSAFVWRPDWWN
jgi:hypothetical protein